ncbi:MAG: tRNA (adenosine(37)-N6)-threonylcarbamoyltransferase complex ATPase subunit type 1 TsaE [Verrucomicrobiae bacterium]|nr:tRNA (adenosine(37)-N6)-threonylcarbamoyltransferase complex ATPase subunit type 1 TsaE [Verrucomicrobiae bacterium]
MDTCISDSPEDTERLGERLGRLAQPGWVFGLTGPLGMGKTQWVKGLARGLGVRARIVSPTFGLVNEYRRGRLPFFHLDLYRLEGAGQILEAGLGAYLPPEDGVAAIEWYERWPGPDPRGLCRVWFHGEGEWRRRIEYELPGH